MTARYIVDFLPGVTVLDAPRVIWGSADVDPESDVISVRGAGRIESTQIGGALPLDLARQLLRELWRRHFASAS